MRRSATSFRRRNRTQSFWVMLCFFCFLCTGTAFLFEIAPVSGFQTGSGAASGAPSSRRGASVPVVSGASAAPSGTKAAPAADGMMKAVWITTVSNTDFPSKPGLSAAEQQAQIRTILDKVKSMKMNTVILQVRPRADALYPSAYFPWSNVLTGTQGQSPGYDPLGYFAAQAHARGLKLQAWINPYAVQWSYDLSKLSANNPAKLHPDWTVRYGNALYFNPGVPEVNRLIENGVTEIVRKYAVDGIHLDDYFYPDPSFQDAATYKKYGNGKPLADWRRANVNSLIQTLHTQIKAINPKVQFGISPFAVWANKADNPLGSDTQAGVQSYSDQFADTRLWVKSNWLDYICPQVYWTMDFSKASFKTVTDWWVNAVKGTNVALYVGQAVYKQDTAVQAVQQIQYASKYSEYKGSVFFGYAQLAANDWGVTDALSRYYTDSK